MYHDFHKHLTGATRTVTKLERDGQAARGVTLERPYDTSPEDLWDAITNPERLPRWFLPVTGELRLGGRYQLEGNAGGTITECVPPEALSMTWEFAGEMSWVEVRIAAEADGRSRLTLCHICPVDEEYWPKYGPGAAGLGWDLGLTGLAMHLAGGAKEDFDENAFGASPEGKALIAAFAEAWGRADVESGEDPAHAAASARRTTAFYTGEELVDA